jgi:PAS domain S-box-containing protein
MDIDDLDVARALQNGEFLPHFQPLVELRSGQLRGFELLARWFRAEREWVSPEIFIPIAERDGWIGRLTQELLRQGFQAMAALPGSIALSINISAAQLRDPALPSKVEAVAHAAGFSMKRLVVEVTESALAQEVPSARAIAETFKALGARLALDDFGTGYSSLSQLQSLPFDELKVDRSFVGSMIAKRESRKIVGAVVGLGQSLGLTTVAEGVETREQAEMLRWLGCELAQGWYFGRPVGAAALAELVAGSGNRTLQPLPGGVTDRFSLGNLDSLPAQRLSQLQAVYDGAPVGLAFLDREMRYRNLNRRLANMNGRPMEEHLGRTVQEMVPELFPSVEPLIRRALDGEAIPGVEVTKPESSPNGGRTLLLSYEPARDEAGEVEGVSVAIVDVTPVKRAEAARAESEAHFRHMIELLPQIPWIIDPEGRALDVSQRWLEITGMNDEQWRGFGWLDALHSDDLAPTWAAMREAFATKRPIDIVYRVWQPSREEWLALRSRGAPRINEAGEVVCWYGCLEPLEDRKSLAVDTVDAEDAWRAGN